MYGYDDAEELYRIALDKGAQPLCTDEGKRWIDDFDRKFPMPTASIGQTKQGLDEFYKDWRNQRINLWQALNVVRLQIAGTARPSETLELPGKI